MRYRGVRTAALTSLRSLSRFVRVMLRAGIGCTVARHRRLVVHDVHPRNPEHADAIIGAVLHARHGGYDGNFRAARAKLRRRDRKIVDAVHREIRETIRERMRPRFADPCAPTREELVAHARDVFAKAQRLGYVAVIPNDVQIEVMR